MALNVYYTPQELCSSDVNTTLGVPTRPTDPTTGKTQSWPSPFILMVNHGDDDGCSTVTKVRNAILVETHAQLSTYVYLF
jgi:hypothetical protein